MLYLCGMNKKYLDRVILLRERDSGIEVARFEFSSSFRLAADIVRNSALLLVTEFNLMIHEYESE